MKCVKLLLIGILFFSRTEAQVNHFIYIQAENKLPFYAKLNDRLYSSAASGYLIIPQLQDGSYTITIGFPKNEWPVQIVNIQVAKQDQGYLLKNFDSKGWGLFNLQTMQVIMANGDAALKNTTVEKKDDGFSNVLAQVVNNPSINQKPAGRDSAINLKDTSTKENKPIVEEVKENGSNSVKRIGSISDNDGRSLIYASLDEGKIDTIILFIPNIESTQNPRAIRSTDRGLKEGMDSADKIKETTGIIVTNVSCNKLAGENDFLRLRKEMAAAENEEEMVTIAKERFKIKCFNTGQLRNLSVLFLKDEGKYHFLNAAYPYTSDQHNFKTLRSLLLDENYLGQFDAIMH